MKFSGMAVHSSTLPLCGSYVSMSAKGPSEPLTGTKHQTRIASITASERQQPKGTMTMHPVALSDGQLGSPAISEAHLLELTVSASMEVAVGESSLRFSEPAGRLAD